MKQPKLTRSEYRAKMQTESERLLREVELPPLDKLRKAHGGITLRMGSLKASTKKEPPEGGLSRWAETQASRF